MPKISALPEATSLLDADDLLIAQSGQTKRVGFDTLRNQVFASSRWQVVAASKYTATPVDTIQLTMSDTSDFAAGLPVKYVFGGTSYYGIVYSVTTNANIKIAGALLNVAQPLTSLSVGTPEMVIQRFFYIPGDTYGDSVRTILATVGMQYFKWEMGTGYLVRFTAVNKTADSTAYPKINVQIAGASVSTQDGNLGLQLGLAGVWQGEALTQNYIDSNNYQITYGEALEIACTAAAGTGNAADLTVSCIFVLG